MKKVALSLLAFALVGAGAYAADAAKDIAKNPVTFSLDVNANVDYGMDLDTKVHGFQYGSTGKLTLWFLNGTSTNEGAGDVHGYISAADVKYGIDDTNTVPALSFGDITAKIVAPNAYVQISTKRDASVGYGIDGDNDNGGASIVSNDTYYRYFDKYGATAGDYTVGTVTKNNEWVTGTLASWASFGGAGLEAGYTIPKLVSIVGVVASESDWTVAQQAGYEASVAVGLLAVDKLTLEGKFYTGKATDALNAIGGTVAYDLGVVTPFANANLDVTNSKYTADFGAKLAPVDGLKAVVVGTYGDTFDPVVANTVNVFADKVVDFTATVNLASGKLAGPLSADVGFRMLDLTKAISTTTNASTEIFAKVGLKLADALNASATVDTYNATTSSDSSLFAKASLEYTGISLTTLGVYWDSSDLGAAKLTGDSKLGAVKGMIKVAY
jgi:hypothetical protein